MNRLLSFIKNDDLRLFVKYFLLSFILFTSIVSLCMHLIIANESNPFFYATF